MQIILAHIWSFTQRDADFWRNVSQELEQHGYTLALTGYSPTTIFDSYEIPYLFLRMGPTPGCIYHYTHTVEHQGLTEQDVEEIIHAEQSWRSVILSDEEKKNCVESVQYYAFMYDLILKLLNPALVLIWNGYHPLELILRRIADKRTTNSIFIERGPVYGTLFIDKSGILNASNFYHTYDENSILQEDECTKWLDAARKIIENYNTTNTTWWEQPEELNNNWRQKLNIGSRKVILFAEQIDNDTQNILFSPNFEKNIDALQWLCAQQNLNFNEVFIVAKKHPKSMTTYHDVEKILEGKGMWVDNIPLRQCFELSDYVVAVNSTILHEAFMKKKPALALGSSLLTCKNIVYEITDITNSKEVSVEIEKWLYAQNLELRYENYMKYLAIMLKIALFSLVPPSEEGGMNGAKEFASTIRCLTMPKNNYQGDLITALQFVELHEQKERELERLSSILHSKTYKMAAKLSYLYRTFKKMLLG